MGGMDKVIKEFLAESFENLDQLDQDLVTLEKNPEDRSVFEGIFRTIHTIKGTCGFLAFGKLEQVTHIGETVLSHLRGGQLDLRPEITSALLQMFDAVRAILTRIDTEGSEGSEDYSDLIATLKTFDDEASSDDSAEKKSPTELNANGAEKNPAQESKKASGKAGKGSKTKTGKRSGRINLDDLVEGDEAAQVATHQPAVSATVLPEPTFEVSKPTPEIAKTLLPNPPPAIGSDTSATNGSPPGAGSDTLPLPGPGDTSIRVDVDALDRLMNLVGELVLARNQILQYSKTATDSSFVAASQRLNGVTGELQEAVMKTRMQPISAVWGKLPRFVRDLALKFNKDVEIELDGQETELDKSVIEAIKGSLLHLVRNSVDHGLETPDDRERLGKPRTGHLSLRADHEGGFVIIEVSDDGRGLDRESIIFRAIEKGLILADQASTLSEREIHKLIFLPGFSTARSVTNISGRGVGLDVVRTNIESIGGSIDLVSEVGLSTTFRMKIPLTLAIIPVLIVTVGDHRFAIPQVAVIELVRLESDRGNLGIERLHGVPVYRLRGNLLPLVFLHKELDINANLQRETDEGSVNIVVLQGDYRLFGLVVDSIDDSQEIVVKPLGRLLKGLPYAGATILGDGKVSIILDIFRLGLAAGVVSEARDHGMHEADAVEAEAEKERATLLYLEGRDDGRRAIPFAGISRLEFFSRSKIENVGGQDVIQYRDEILQLLHLEEILPERRSRVRAEADPSPDDAIQVVVCSVEGRSVGVVVHRIIDIVEESLDVKRPASREGVESCVVIQERVTEVIDLRGAILLADPGFFDRPIENKGVVSS